MSERTWNFSPGPAALPRTVLERAAALVRDPDASGASILEVSHRSTRFAEVLEEAESGIRELLAVPDGFHVLFLQGGASLQFAMAPMNLLHGEGSWGAYVVTGSWAAKALAEGARVGAARPSWDGRGSGYDHVPGADELDATRGATFVHTTSNETIEGVQWPADPSVPEPARLVCDMSSDLLSRPLDLGRYALVYAGAQKNVGAAGVTIVLVRDDVLDEVPDGLPAILDYRTHVRAGSLYNTPPVFSIAVVALITRWIREAGGLAAIAERNEAKARLLYETIDASEGFYRGHARPDSRSRMNVTFRLPDRELEQGFLSTARAEGLVELQGHRSVGGVRASIYNAMPIEGVRALADLMERFRSEHAATRDRAADAAG